MCVKQLHIHTHIREFGSILSPIPLLPSPISMASIISLQADQQYIIVKQVTALSTSNLRFIIQACFLIVLVFWLGLVKVNWVIFPHHMLLHHFLCCCSCQLHFWPLFQCNKGRNSLLLLEWMLMRGYSQSLINCYHTSLSSSSGCNTGYCSIICKCN